MNEWQLKTNILFKKQANIQIKINTAIKKTLHHSILNQPCPGLLKESAKRRPIAASFPPTRPSRCVASRRCAHQRRSHRRRRLPPRRRHRRGPRNGHRRWGHSSTNRHQANVFFAEQTGVKQEQEQEQWPLTMLHGWLPMRMAVAVNVYDLRRDLSMVMKWIARTHWQTIALTFE